MHKLKKNIVGRAVKTNTLSTFTKKFPKTNSAPSIEYPKNSAILFPKHLKFKTYIE